jgi:hypothetical protein
MGRLQTGATLAQAEAEMAPRFARASAGAAGDSPRLRLADGRRGLTRPRHEQQRPLVGLAAVTGLALLMACATVAGLLFRARRGKTAGDRHPWPRAGRRRMLRTAPVGEHIVVTLAAGSVCCSRLHEGRLAASLMRQGALAVPYDARALVLALAQLHC